MNHFIIRYTIFMCFLAYWIKYGISKGPLYVRKKDTFLQSAEFYNITTRSETSCVIECENMAVCKNVNIIKPALVGMYNCQFFNFSTSLLNSTLINARNATLYTVERSEKAVDCQALKNSGLSSSGKYTLMVLNDYSEMQVYCDMNTNGSAWMVLQKRFNGNVDFLRTWDEYKNGFGSFDGEFWLGLEKAHQLMKEGNMTLRFDMWDGDDYAYMEYHEATLSDESDKYRLDWKGTPTGNAGDSMANRNKNQQFSTKDNDNDIAGTTHCAELFRGAWWFGHCLEAHLNGEYGDDRPSFGLSWHSFRGTSTSLSKTEIKFKRNY